eukprot:SAG31_NODE_21739_length_542_cov_0.647856_1_plen_117_part_01
MQIDTWNRDKMNISGGDPFVSGPVPPHSLAPTAGPDAIYSGLLECPLTTRIKKTLKNGKSAEGPNAFNDSFTTELHSKGDTCTHAVADSKRCFAAADLLPGLANMSLHTATVSSAVL